MRIALERSIVYKNSLSDEQLRPFRIMDEPRPDGGSRASKTGKVRFPG